jgi:hypothetical protein
MPTVPTLRRDLREVRVEEVRVGIKEDGKRKKTIIARNSTRPVSSWGIRSTYPQIWSLSYQCGFLPHESPHPSLSNTFPLCHHAAARRAVFCCQPSGVRRRMCVCGGAGPSSGEGVLLLSRWGAAWL